MKYKVRHFTALYTLHLKETKELHRKGQVIKKKWLSIPSWSGLSCHSDSMPPSTTPTHIHLLLCVIGTAATGSSHLWRQHLCTASCTGVLPRLIIKIRSLPTTFHRKPDASAERKRAETRTLHAYMMEMNKDYVASPCRRDGCYRREERRGWVSLKPPYMEQQRHPVVYF